MTTPHTPIPWRVELLLTPELDDDPMGTYVVQPAKAQLEERYFALDIEEEEDQLEAIHAENQANAELICKAVNSFEAMREALNNIIAECYTTFPDGLPEGLRQVISEADLNLLAEGKDPTS